MMLMIIMVTMMMIRMKVGLGRDEWLPEAASHTGRWSNSEPGAAQILHNA